MVGFCVIFSVECQFLYKSIASNGKTIFDVCGSISMVECPGCGYDLQGLPREHTCPECGLNYDPDTTLIRLTIHRWNQKQYALSVLFTVVMVYRCSRYGIRREDLWLFFLLGVSVFVSACTILRTNNEKATLLLNRSGIQLDHPRFGKRYIPWSMIGRIRWNWITGTFSISGRDGKNILSMNRRDVGGRKTGQRCAEEANRLYRRMKTEA